jgi:hypothetical protein
MILYKKYGVSFDQLKSKVIFNVSNSLLTLLILLDLSIGFVTNWTFTFWFVFFFVVVFCSVHLYTLKKAHALIIESLEDYLYIVYSKYFSVLVARIKNEDVTLELFETSAGSYGRPLYLYIGSRSNRSLEIELPNDQKSIAHVLTKIYEVNKIEIQPRELNFINQYKNQVAVNKSTKGKVYNFLIAAFFIILIIVIIYHFR